MRHKKKKNEQSTYGIIGLGRFGYALALELAASGAEFIALDCDEERVREIREYTENAYIVRNLDKKSIEETGIRNCDIVVICVDDEMDQSILTTLHVVSLGVPKVIAKASSAEHGEILEKLGAEVVYPERDMAVRLAHRLEAAQMLDYIQLSEKLNLSKLRIPEKLIGKSVIDANLRGEFGVNIIAIENGNSLTELVGPKYTFKKDDILFLSGSRDSLNRLVEWTEQ